MKFKIVDRIFKKEIHMGEYLVVVTLANEKRRKI